MSNHPSLTTARLLLRPFAMRDAPDVQRLCNVREIALNTLLIPHPYPDGAAEEWIGAYPEKFEKGEALTFAITLREGNVLAGAIGMRIQRENDSAEIGYWIGVPFWGRGIATEAVQAVIDYGFDKLALNRIYAEHFTRNPASGRVLQKAGMRHEGTLRQVHKKWGEYVDAEMYAILRSDRR
jgi:ribosomal-protein-alanine N-acetyltransferase